MSSVPDVLSFVSDLGLNVEQGKEGWLCECPRWRSPGHPPGLVCKLNLDLGIFHCPACSDGGSIDLLQRWIDDLIRVTRTDEGNALRLVRMHRHDIRWTQSGWYAWDGQVWIGDPKAKLEVIRRARTVSEEILADAEDLYAKERAEAQPEDVGKKKKKTEGDKIHAWGMQSKSLDKITDMIELTKSEPRIYTDSGDLDRNPWRLNCHNGTIDLTNGGLLPYDRRDLMTKIIQTDYIPGGYGCPKWKAFLHDIFLGDEELIRYVQKAVGYSLTGLTSEQSLFILHGDGENGKSKFLKVITELLGPYALSTRPEAFMLKKNDSMPDEIAHTNGVRLVVASEATDRRLDESLVKQLTGGDRMMARFLYKSSFQFEPKFKLWISGNYKPSIKGTDRGIWRRMRLIPFNYQVPPEKKDLSIEAKLLAELVGVLEWAVKGCLLWQKEGLTVPKAVEAATEAYRQESDPILAFLDEKAHASEGYVAKQALYSIYREWAEDRGEVPLPSKKFNDEMRKQGFADRHMKFGYVWINLQLSVKT